MTPDAGRDVGQTIDHWIGNLLLPAMGIITLSVAHLIWHLTRWALNKND